MAAFNPNGIPDLNDYFPLSTYGSGRDFEFLRGAPESYGFGAGIAEAYARSFYGTKAEPDPITVPKNSPGQLPRAAINQFALFNYSGFFGTPSSDDSAGYRDGTEASRGFTGRGIGVQNPTIASILEFYNTNYPNIAYRMQDFLYAKYYRKIPLNHMLTLRRFPMPCEDNIFDYQIAVAEGEGGKIPLNLGAKKEEIDATQLAGVTAVTYMGETAGNKLSELMSMTFGLKWKDLESKMEEIEQEGGYTNQPLTKTFGALGGAVADVAKGIPAGRKFALENSSTADKLASTYADFVLGPVNVIDKTTIRDRGLKFDHDMKLVFEYELRSLNYVNPKVAMIDIISNMLTMTTNNANFWGGGQRYYGAAGYVASQFGDINKLKSGNFAEYTKSVTDDVTSGLKKVFGNSNGNITPGTALAGSGNVIKQFLGNKLGDLLKSISGDLGSTAAQRTFISAEPTGNWHLTVGNPLNPIVTMGNLYCDGATMTMGDGLGYDDFPMEVKFEINLKHGKPRDKGDIENMFNAGQGRIYASAKGEADLLNLAGLDLNTYGSLRVGRNNVQATQGNQSGQTTNTGGAANSAANADIGNISGRQAQAKADGNTKPGDYVSNLVSLMIDS